MDEVAAGLSLPNRHAMSAFDEVMRAWRRYAHRADAPAWVRALEAADRVVRTPPAPPDAPRGALSHLAARSEDEALEIAARVAAVLQDAQGAQGAPATRGVPKTRPQEAGGVSAATPASMRQRQAMGIDPYRAREFARTNEWMRSAINKLKGRVARADRGVVPLDPQRPFDAALQARITWLIENPNPMMDSWRTFVEPPVEDVITLGKGGWENVPNWRGWPTALYHYDAAYMQIIPGWDGTNPRAPRYAFGMNPGTMVGLRNDEATLILLNPTTFRREGLGHVETLKNSIESDAAGNEFIRGMLKKYPPPGWLDLGEQATSKQIRSVAERLVSDILGTGGILVTGGHKQPKFQSLWNGTSKDNELMAWSIYFARKIAAVCGISPQDFGITLDINKASSETQENLSMEDGFKAILLLVEEYVNREIVVRFGYPEEINLAFRFKELTLKDRLRQAQIVKTLLGDVPVVMINEGRRELDLLPVEGGNAIYINTATGLMPVIGEDAAAARERMAAQGADDAEAEATGAAGESAPGAGKAKETGKGTGKAAGKKRAPLALARYDPEGWRAGAEDAAVLALLRLTEPLRAEVGELVHDYLLFSAAVRRRSPEGPAPAGECREALRLAAGIVRRAHEGFGAWALDMESDALTRAYGYHLHVAGLEGEEPPAAQPARARSLGRAFAMQAGRALTTTLPPTRLAPDVAADCAVGLLDAWVAETGWRLARRAARDAARASLRLFLLRHPALDGDFLIWQAEGCDCSATAAPLGRTPALLLVLGRAPCGGTHDVVPLAYRGGLT